MAKSGKKKSASATGQTGSIGQTYVKAALEELGWGPVPVTEHDVGTDFFVQVADQDRVQLGLLLGVQVKNEKKYFEQKALEKARALGAWEYEAKPADAEYLSNHSIPHLLVLFDRDTKTGYWGYVTRQVVRWTEKGARVPVAVENVLGPSTLEQLLHVASEGRRSIAWSPAAWKGVAGIPPSRRLRTALLAPRVAAPGRAIKGEHVEPEEAIAHLMLGRFPRPGSDSLPPEQEQLDGSFAWRLHAAFWTYLKTGQLHDLEALACTASESYERVAHLAIRAAITCENGDPRAALAMLDTVDQADLVDPVDGTWLDAHRSRCLRELNQPEAAHKLALKVAATGLLHAHDHGAVALRAAVLGNTLYSLHSPHADRQAALAAMDSPPVWWRDQHRAWALTEVLEQTYKNWAGPRREAKVDPDAWARLRGVTLSTGINADHGAWRVAASELAQYELIGIDLDDHDRVTGCLNDLRTSGDKDAVTRAIDRLLLEGPIEPVRDLAKKCDPATSSRTGLTSTLEVLKLALEVLDQETLQRHSHWTLHQLQHPGELVTPDLPFRWLAKDYLIPTLRKAYRLLPDLDQDLIRRHLLTMAPIADQMLAESYASLVRSLPHDAWPVIELLELHPRADLTLKGDSDEVTHFGDHISLGRAFSAVLAHAGDSERLQALYTRLAEGQWEALEDLDGVGSIPTDTLRQLLPHLAKDLEERAAQAATGMVTMPFMYAGEVLLIINVNRPDLAHWEPIHHVLEGGASRWDQARLARRLPDLADLLDQEVIDRLAPALEKLAGEQDDTPIMPSKVDEAARIGLLELTTRLDDPEGLRVALSAGEQGRQAVAHAIGRRRDESDLALLAALATDQESSVRAAAAGAATTWQRHEPHPTVQSLLDDLLRAGGYANVYAVMRAIRHEQHNEAIHAILRQLTTHPSARVRWRANELLQDPENCRC